MDEGRFESVRLLFDVLLNLTKNQERVSTGKLVLVRNDLEDVLVQYRDGAIPNASAEGRAGRSRPSEKKITGLNAMLVFYWAWPVVDDTSMSLRF